MLGVDKINKWATAARPGRDERHRSAERSAGPGAVDGVEARRQKHEKWYAGETISVGDRPGRGLGDAGVDGGLHGDARQRRHARDAAPAQGRSTTGAGWKPVPAPAPKSQVDIDPEKLEAIRDGMWGVVNARAAPACTRAGSPATTSSGKTGTAQVISNAGPRGGRDKTDKRPARQRLVRVLRAARQPEDCRRRVPRARHPRRQRRARRAPHPRHLLREAGRKPLPPPPTHDRRARYGSVRTRRRAVGRRASLMFERRLYYHIDWVLVAAMFALCALGVAMIYSADVRSDARGVASTAHADVRASASASSRWSSRLAIDYRILTDKSHCIYIALLARAARTCCSSARCDGRAALDSDSGLQPAAVRVRQDRRRAGAREVLRREPPRRADTDRPRDRRRADGRAARAHRASSPISGTAVTLLPVFLGVAYLAGHAHAHPRHPRRWPACSRRRSPGSSRSRTTRAHASRPSSIPRRMRRAPDTSRSRRASPSDRADYGEGLHAGHAGPVAVPARRPQRLHLLGAGRGAGVRRRARGARACICS